MRLKAMPVSSSASVSDVFSASNAASAAADSREARRAIGKRAKARERQVTLACDALERALDLAYHAYGMRVTWEDEGVLQEHPAVSAWLAHSTHRLMLLAIGEPGARRLLLSRGTRATLARDEVAGVAMISRQADALLALAARMRAAPTLADTTAVRSRGDWAPARAGSAGHEFSSDADGAYYVAAMTSTGFVHVIAFLPSALPSAPRATQPPRPNPHRSPRSLR